MVKILAKSKPYHHIEATITLLNLLKTHIFTIFCENRALYIIKAMKHKGIQSTQETNKKVYLNP